MESASGPITAIEPRLPASSGSRPPSLRSRTAERSAAMRATSRCAGSASTSRARSSSTYGVVEEAHPDLRLEHPPHAGVDVASAHRSGRQRLGQVGVGGVGDRHLHVHPGVDRACGGIAQIRGEAVGDETPDHVGVAHHEALESPGLAQHLGEQPSVAAGGNTVQAHVRGHHVSGAGVDRRLERREVDVPEFGVGQVDLVVVAPTERGSVPGHVLRAGDDPLGCTELAALEAA